MCNSPASPPELQAPVDERRQSRDRLLSRLRRSLPVLTLLVVVALVVRAVAGDSGQIGRSLRLLEHPEPAFLGLAVVAEVLSYLSYATAQRRLARAMGHNLSRRWLASLAIAAQALVDFMPAGYVAGNLLSFRELRRRSLSVGQCAWLLGMTSLLYVGALLALACAGATLDYHGGWVPRVLGLGGLAVIVAVGTLATARTPSRHLVALRRLALAIAAWLERRRGVAARVAVTGRDVAAQMSQTALMRSDTAFVATLFALSWLTDAGCLTLSFAALRTSPPWDALLVAYAAAQLVSYLPLSPGGFGLVEGSLTVTLTIGGRGLSSVLAAVLLYRGLSYWGMLPAGALGYVSLRRTRHPRDPVAAATASEPTDRIRR